MLTTVKGYRFLPAHHDEVHASSSAATSVEPRDYLPKYLREYLVSFDRKPSHQSTQSSLPPHQGHLDSINIIINIIIIIKSPIIISITIININIRCVYVS